MSDSSLVRNEAQLAAAGIRLEEAERQIELLRDPPEPADLDRCCTLEDGIRVLAPCDHPALEAAWHDAAAQGRFAKFVPASGAASRMFSPLEELRATSPPSLDELRRRADAGDPTAVAVVELLDRLEDLPFYESLATSRSLGGNDPRRLASGDDYPSVLAAILDADGLGFSRYAKGLIPFHRYLDTTHSALDEHLAEAVDYVRGPATTGTVHFTVAEPWLRDFEHAADASSLAAGLEVSFSTQHPRTSTLSLDTQGRPACTTAGDLLLRPGGHGALLQNLQELGGDLVYLKNVDNVVPDSRRGEVSRWQRLLGGLLAELEGRTRRLLEALLSGDDSASLEEAVLLCRRELGHRLPPQSAPTQRSTVLALLDRPLRVCGMVPNAGEPGGGPFWVRDRTGTAYPQIVESAQVALDDAAQRQIWRSSTHFNPVMLVASLRRLDGSQHRLADFVDKRAVFVTDKSFAGRTLRVLEHPGLWNGAMARWNTVFVEVPLDTFAPVKTVLDLLRPAHQVA